MDAEPENAEELLKLAQTSAHSVNFEKTQGPRYWWQNREGQVRLNLSECGGIGIYFFLENETWSSRTGGVSLCPDGVQ